MHKNSSVLDFDASKYDHSGDDERFWTANGRIAGVAGLIFIAAKNGEVARMDVPSFGHADFHSAKYTIYFQDRFGSDVRIAKIEFNAAKYGCDSAALEIRAGHPPFATAEDRDRVQHGLRAACAGDLLPEVL